MVKKAARITLPDPEGELRYKRIMETIEALRFNIELKRQIRKAQIFFYFVMLFMILVAFIIFGM